MKHEAVPLLLKATTNAEYSTAAESILRVVREKKWDINKNT